MQGRSDLCIRYRGAGHGDADEGREPLRGAPGQADGITDGDQVGLSEPSEDVPPGRRAIGRPGFHGDPQRL